MSRPFSYNDENFTVIGNVLFVHIKYEKKASAGAELIEIPPAIYDRLLFFSTMGCAAFSTSDSNSYNVMMSVIAKDNKFYLSSKSNLSAIQNRFLFGTFMLKYI